MCKGYKHDTFDQPRVVLLSVCAEPWAAVCARCWRQASLRQTHPGAACGNRRRCAWQRVHR